MKTKSTILEGKDTGDSRKPATITVERGFDPSKINLQEYYPMEMSPRRMGFDLPAYLSMSLAPNIQPSPTHTAREELDYRAPYEPAEVAKALYSLAFNSGSTAAEAFDALNLPYPFEIQGLSPIETVNYQRGSARGDYRHTINTLLDSTSPATEARKSIVELLMLHTLKVASSEEGAARMLSARSGAKSEVGPAQLLEALCTAYKLETPMQGVELGDPKVEGVGAMLLKGIAGLETLWDVGFYPSQDDFNTRYESLNPRQEPATPAIVQGWNNYFSQVMQEYGKLIAAPSGQIA